MEWVSFLDEQITSGAPVRREDISKTFVSRKQSQHKNKLALVGVVCQRETTVRPLDIHVTGVFGNTQHRIQVACAKERLQ